MNFLSVSIFSNEDTGDDSAEQSAHLTDNETDVFVQGGREVLTVESSDGKQR